MYLLEKLQQQCHHEVSEPFFRVFVKHHFSGKSFFMGEIMYLQYMLHLPSVFGIKCLEAMYEQ